ncbi:MAG: TetR/AcrR family transcriptional regulator [Cyanobacteria bacterium P01_A01_bin.17]
MFQAALVLLGEVGFDGMSMDAIASRARVGKTTIYRRYSNKEELVADAIERIREDITIPDTGSLERDIDILIENAAQMTLSPVGRQTVALIISSASSNPKFAEIYRDKYLQPRRSAFAEVLERAKQRQEVRQDLDPWLVFDMMSGIMLHALLFLPKSESWIDYVRRAVHLLIQKD